MKNVKVDLSKTVDVDWDSEEEHWNTYELDDGTVLKVKLVLKGVKRVKGQYSPDGNPIYLVNSQNIVRATNIPEDLKGPVKKDFDYKANVA
ncbi:MAG: hypothetical protein ACLFVP_01345 [Candidatus Bathyarchaeia archaeon]